MMTVLTVLLVLCRVVAITVALGITVTSYRAYCRTGNRMFRYAVGGFALLALGTGIGIASSLLAAAPTTVTGIHTLQSAMLAVGFLFLYLSIGGSGAGVDR